MSGSVDPLNALVDLNPEMNFSSIRIPLADYKSRMLAIRGVESDLTKLALADRIFRRRIEMVSAVLNKDIVSSVNPQLLLLRVSHFFEYYIEDKLNRLVSESPNQEDILNEWNQFKILFAELRYRPTPELIRRMKEICDKFEAQLKRFETYEDHIETSIWSFFQLALTDSDLFDHTITHLAQPNWDKEKPQFFSVSFGLKYRNFLLLKAKRDFIWLCDEIEKLMRPFTDGEQRFLFNDSIRTLQFVNELRTLVIPTLDLLVTDDLDFICRDKKVFAVLTNFYENYGKNKNHPISDYGVEQKEIGRLLSEEFKDCPDSKNLRALDLIRKYKLSFPPKMISKSDKHFNLGQLRKALQEFFPVREKCHELFDTYFLANYSCLEDITHSLQFWGSSRESKSKFANILKTVLLKAEEPKRAEVQVRSPDSHLLPQALLPLPPKAPPAPVISEEERLKLQQELLHEESLKAKAKREKKAKKQQRQQQFSRPRLSPNTSPETEKKIPSMVTQTLSEPLSFRRMALDGHAVMLVELVNSVEAHFQKNALRHALQAYEDLQVLKKRLKGPIEVNERLVIVSMAGLAMHQLFEQSFRFSTIKRDEKSWDHNLKAYVDKVEAVKSVWQVVFEVSLANFWVDNSYLQLEQRSRVSFRKIAPPKLLVDVVELDQHPESVESAKILTNVRGIVKEAIEASQNYKYSESVVSAEASHRELNEFHVQWNAKIEELEGIQKELLKINAKFDPRNTHAIFFKQAVKDLHTLKGFVELLKKPVLSHELSLIVRNICRFEHLLCQNLMRGLINLQNGRHDEREHDLVKLYDLTKWDKAPAEGERGFLREYFGNAHHFSKYMFSDKSAGSKLHSAMLAAEMLRERAELNDGFELDPANPKTSLNYIPVDPAMLKVSSITHVLNQAHAGMMGLVAGRILPQLKKAAL